MKDDYYDFIEKINKRIGIELRLYKETQMRRRITTLRDKRGYSSFGLYYQALFSNKELLDEFIDRLTINVSEFYRNPKRWDVLIERIIPILLKQKSKIQIWSAACSTGEEPYSLAMAMKHNFPTTSFQILATDIDENALKKAKNGVYLEQALKDLPKVYKDKYFVEQENMYHIDHSLKRYITFKKHNLLADIYPKKVDLIVCRNVLIYFTEEAKNQIYQNFSKSLEEHGVLFVGSTEQIFNPNQFDLSLIDTFFYQKS
ncbi:protein-glutamate O-methyltransferase CheR [Oceanobacillus piezotolerans]|uniref:protein-glutamate O-methyltransferase n=2 Tax=Oceanobacillus piezotolerans TaxID=2448030 RepID=A0A498DB02_9BACI|nr:protein-glutamate O-methyltransferase CheR [Oceanobacillus piezotolerans]